MNAALQFLTKLGPARLAAMGGVTLALLVFFAFVIMRVTQPAMGVLYSDLTLQDAAAIIRDLDLRRPRFQQTAAYGHFGREGDVFTWERTDRVDDLLRAANA